MTLKVRRLWVHLQDREERHWVGFSQKGEVEALGMGDRKRGGEKKRKAVYCS